MMKYNIGKTRLLTLGLLAALLLCGPTACMAGIWQGSGQAAGGVAPMGAITDGNLPVWENSGALADSGLVAAGLASYGSRAIVVRAGDDALANMVAFTNAYADAMALNPTMEAPVSVLLPPGTYELLGADAYVFDSEYIYVKGLVHTPLTVQKEYGCTPTYKRPAARFFGYSGASIELPLSGEWSDLRFTDVILIVGSTGNYKLWLRDVMIDGYTTYWNETGLVDLWLERVWFDYASLLDAEDQPVSVSGASQCFSSSVAGMKVFKDIGFGGADHCSSFYADFDGSATVMCDNAGTLTGITTRSGASLPLNQVAGDARFLQLTDTNTLATAAQGALADSAVQSIASVIIVPGDRSPEGNFDDLQAAVAVANVATVDTTIHLGAGEYLFDAHVTVSNETHKVHILGAACSPVTVRQERGCRPADGTSPSQNTIPPSTVFDGGAGAGGGMADPWIFNMIYDNVGSGGSLRRIALKDYITVESYATGEPPSSAILFEDIHVGFQASYQKTTFSSADHVRIFVTSDAYIAFAASGGDYMTMVDCYLAGSTTSGATEFLTTSGFMASHCTGAFLFPGDINGALDHCVSFTEGFGNEPGSDIGSSARLINCTGGTDAFAFAGVIVSGAYLEGCIGGNTSFGGNGEIAGQVVNCIGGESSFASGGTLSGTVTGCTAGDFSFAPDGTLSGTVTSCTAEDYSFAASGTLSGTVTSCTAREYSFAYDGNLSGTVTSCTAGDYSFASSGTITGTGKHYLCINRGTYSGFSADDKTLRGCIEN